MKNKHAFPWSNEGNSVKNAQGHQIGLALDDPYWEENARLMASAPDLLEALEAMVEWQMASMSGKATKGYPGTQAMQAIAKAKGQ